MRKEVDLVRLFRRKGGSGEFLLSRRSTCRIRNQAYLCFGIKGKSFRLVFYQRISGNVLQVILSYLRLPEFTNLTKACIYG